MQLSSCVLELVGAVTVSHSITLYFIVIISQMSSFQSREKTEENMKNS
jgi:hypothetical protein